VRQRQRDAKHWRVKERRKGGNTGESENFFFASGETFWERNPRNFTKKGKAPLEKFRHKGFSVKFWHQNFAKFYPQNPAKTRLSELPYYRRCSSSLKPILEHTKPGWYPQKSHTNQQPSLYYPSPSPFPTTRNSPSC
jgi:hypothetical protein